jgi:hypothetical protein
MPAAAMDVIEACNYYGAKEVSLIEKFRSEINDVYKKLKKHPQFYSYIHSKRKTSFRDVSLSSFPILIIVPVIISLYAYFKYFTKKEKIKLWLFGVTTFVACYFIWFFWLGKLLFPFHPPIKLPLIYFTVLTFNFVKA